MQESVKPKPIEVYAEATPNPESLKFVMNRLLLRGKSFDFENKESAKNAPIAQALFDLGYIKRVFFANNFITLTKVEDKMWVELIPEIRTFIKEYMESGKRVFDDALAEEQSAESSEEEDGDAVARIKQILNDHVKPAVEMDGGAIDFKSFDEGVVTVALKGSCSGCPSATVTLKSGIEGLLKRAVPGVTEVVAEEL